MTDFNRTTLRNRILTGLIGQKLSGAMARALIAQNNFALWANLKYFPQSTDFRYRHMHACTQQCLYGIQWSLRKSKNFPDIKHKQQTLIKKPLPRGLGLELQLWTQQMSSWLSVSPAQTLFGHWPGSRRQGQHNHQSFDNVSLKQLHWRASLFSTGSLTSKVRYPRLVLRVRELCLLGLMTSPCPSCKQICCKNWLGATPDLN